MTARLTYGILSSAPPTPCGLATFTTALGSALARQGANVGVVRVTDQPEFAPVSVLPIIGRLVGTDSATIEATIEALNRCDVAVIQHEYGLYGGRDGDDVLRVIAGLRVPTIAILHTVLSLPTWHQVEVLNAVMAHVDSVVVMTETALHTLQSVFEIGATPVAVIPHGAAVIRTDGYMSNSSRPVLLTWGLIGPGKGIEWVIEAMAGLKDLDPKPLYLIAGRTHPKVLAQFGDHYRESLERRVVDNGVEELVSFDNSYRTLASLSLLIECSDIVVLPYDSLDQATSGVLVDAVAAGRPVVATAFPHAIELLNSGAGLVVPQKDVAALSGAIRRVLTEPGLATGMAAEARRIAPTLSWDAVGGQYSQLAGQLQQRSAVPV